MNILDKIVIDKKKEVEQRKTKTSIKELETMPFFGRKTLSLSNKIRSSSVGIIAEHKRKSPSKDIINNRLNLTDVVQDYESNGASGVSILTDFPYFGGTLTDLIEARNSIKIPILRKDFIIDEYQILEAKAYGADVILLIAAIIEKSKVKQLSEFAQSLDLEVLLEVHNRTELENSLIPNINMIGVNNRDLKTFNVNLKTSKNLSKYIPDSFIKVSESGISDPNSIIELQQYGYEGFLIGENFMKTNKPGNALKEFIKKVSHET